MNSSPKDLRDILQWIAKEAMTQMAKRDDELNAKKSY